MEGDVSLGFLKHLVNVAVEDRDRSELFHQRQRGLAVVGAPAPLGVDGPERNVGVNDDRGAGSERFEIFFEPVESAMAPSPGPSNATISIEAESVIPQ